MPFIFVHLWRTSFHLNHLIIKNNTLLRLHYLIKRNNLHLSTFQYHMLISVIRCFLDSTIHKHRKSCLFFHYLWRPLHLTSLPGHSCSSYVFIFSGCNLDSCSHNNMLFAYNKLHRYVRNYISTPPMVLTFARLLT